MRFFVFIPAGLALLVLSFGASAAHAQIDVAEFFEDQVDNGPWGCARCESDGGYGTQRCGYNCGCGGPSCGCEAECGCEPACGEEVGCCDQCGPGRYHFAGMRWNQCDGRGPKRCRCYGPMCQHEPACGCGGYVGEPACGCGGCCGCDSGCGCGVECHNGIGRGVLRRMCKVLYSKVGGCSGCSCELYWSEWHNDPPRCCDPCDKCGNWIGPGLAYRAPYDHSYGPSMTYAGQSMPSGRTQVAKRPTSTKDQRVIRR